MAASTKKPWADTPFKLIPHYETLGYKTGETILPIHSLAMEMIIVHNMLLRGINSIYLQSLSVPTNLQPDFANFALTWGESIEEHHHTEETLLFPVYAKITNEPAIMGAEIAQHEAFHHGLEGYIKYMRSVVAKEEPYDGAKIRRIVDEFMPVLRQHLEDEISTLKGFTRFDEKIQKELVEATHKVSAHIKAEAQKKPEVKTTVLPMMLACHDQTFEGGVHAGFPGLPWFVMLIIKWMFVPKNKGWWQFAPCDASSKPRELPYAEL